MQYTERRTLAAGPAIFNQRSHQPFSAEKHHATVLDLERIYFSPDALPVGNRRILKLEKTPETCSSMAFYL